LLRIDIKTNQTKEYPLPHAYSQPYATAVDKNGVVWINTINLDRIVRFDPKTERFTEFQLPTRGTEVRHIQVDNRTNPPTIWVPYNRVNKVVRLQFRTQPPATSSRQ
jgi:streptogramin lyase